MIRTPTPLKVKILSDIIAKFLKLNAIASLINCGMNGALHLVIMVPNGGSYD